MSNPYIQLPGTTTPLSDLTIYKARAVANMVAAGPYTKFVECRKLGDDREIVIIDAEVELGQHRVNDIRCIERIAVLFECTDRVPPVVLALRADFPKVPHLNLQAYEFPRSLCLFDSPYEEVKLHWTADMFVQRIRDWLAQTAKGTLHGEDQPLEPLLPYSLDQVVLPADAFSAEEPIAFLTISKPIDEGNGLKTFVAKRYRAEDAARQKIPYIAVVFGCKPQTHGVIYAVPQNLYELHTLMMKGDVDLLEHLRKQLEDDLPPLLLDAQVILVIGLQKKRTEISPIEAIDTRAFMLDASVRQLRVELGGWGTIDSTMPKGRLLSADTTKKGDEVPVKMLNPQWSFSPELAAAYNGLSLQADSKLVAVGVGALGSHVVMNLARMGIGRWSIVDDDTLLPHNLARHVLPNSAVGLPKSTSMAAAVNGLYSDQKIADGIVADVMGKPQSEPVAAALADADVIVDMSASVAVSRFLIHNIPSSARRVSLFLNPLATDLVVIAEDENRTHWLDSLEMQYYRGLLHEPSLQDHLIDNDSGIRYANSCRDISVTIPQDLVVLNSAIASRALRSLFEDSNAAIWVWHTDPETYVVAKTKLPLSDPNRSQIGEWTLVTDRYLLDTVCAARKHLLPNETGGMLLGSYDMSRKIVYVVDTILSPPDSVERPTMYVRGCRGLKAQLEKVVSVTAERLVYVGEWHSHPEGNGSRPSQLDRQAFRRLAEDLSRSGMPPLMLIAGQDDQCAVYLDRMESWTLI